MRHLTMHEVHAKVRSPGLPPRERRFELMLCAADRHERQVQEARRILRQLAWEVDDVKVLGELL